MKEQKPVQRIVNFTITLRIECCSYRKVITIAPLLFLALQFFFLFSLSGRRLRFAALIREAQLPEVIWRLISRPSAI